MVCSCPILSAFQQTLCLSAFQGSVPGASTCAFDGTCFDHSIADSQEAFWRGADDLKRTTVEITGKGAGLTVRSR